MFYNIVAVMLIALQMTINLEEVTADSSGVEMPNSCVQSGKAYCFEKGDKYPDDIIAKLFKGMEKLEVEAQDPPLINLDSRNGYAEKDCPSDFNTNPIHYIIDENEKVRVVVQSPDYFQQIYTIRWCLNEGRLTDSTPNFLKDTLENNHIECVNTMMKFEFLVLSENMDAVEIAMVEVPVCCNCRHKK